MKALVSSSMFVIVFVIQIAAAQEPSIGRYQILGPASFSEFNRSENSFTLIFELETDTGKLRVCKHTHRLNIVMCSQPATPFESHQSGKIGRFQMFGLQPGSYSFGKEIGATDANVWVVDGSDGRVRSCLISLLQRKKSTSVPNCTSVSPEKNDKFPRSN